MTESFHKKLSQYRPLSPVTTILEDPLDKMPKIDMADELAKNDPRIDCNCDSIPAIAK